MSRKLQGPREQHLERTAGRKYWVPPMKTCAMPKGLVLELKEAGTLESQPELKTWPFHFASSVTVGNT